MDAGTVGYGLSGAVGTITVLQKNERYKEKLYQIVLGVLESKSQYNP